MARRTQVQGHGKSEKASDPEEWVQDKRGAKRANKKKPSAETDTMAEPFFGI